MSEKGMLAELKNDAFMNSADIVMPDLIKMVKPFIKPVHKQLSYELGADQKFFLIRKVLSEDEDKLAKELTVQIEELKKINELHKDIAPLEKKRNLLGTICFYVIETENVEEFSIKVDDNGAPKIAVEYPLADAEQLIVGLISGDLYRVDKTL